MIVVRESFRNTPRCVCEHTWVGESFNQRNGPKALEAHNHALKENGMQQVEKLNNLYGQFYKGKTISRVRDSRNGTFLDEPHLEKFYKSNNLIRPLRLLVR